MVGTFVRAGIQSIKSVKPGTKFKGQMSVSEAKRKASEAALDAAKFDFKKAIKPFVKNRS